MCRNQIIILVILGVVYMEKLTAREKAEMTYNILQKRKIKKAKEKENMVFEVAGESVKRCNKRRRIRCRW
jgi:deoxycytidylate deaminase